jgi:hypothetical protein
LHVLAREISGKLAFFPTFSQKKLDRLKKLCYNGGVKNCAMTQLTFGGIYGS